MKFLKNYFFYLVLFVVGIAGSGVGQYSVLHNFGSSTTDGTSPFGEVTVSGNILYGMAWGGGANGEGSVFSINTNGNNYTDMLDFDWTGNGAYPTGSFILRGKVLYGMTLKGGSNGIGTIFSIDTTGYSDNVFLSFNNNLSPYGAVPYGDLITSGKKLYGMTAAGGFPNDGIIFSIDTNGNGYTILHNFNRTLGAGPLGSLTLSGAMLYGMTRIGGSSDSGCIFSIDTNGTGFADIFDFNSVNGGYPQGSLILSENRLYGMTALGGLYDSGCIFSVYTNGGGYKKLLDFNGANGANPDGSLILSGGLLYGMAYGGGMYDSGCIFSIDTNGTGYNDLFDFNNLNGTNPMGSLTLVGNTSYGMAYGGGINKDGVIFSFMLPCTLTSSATIDSNVTCPGGSNGYAVITPSGGTMPYTYLWNPSGGTDSTASGLSAGTYIVTVKDNNGCVSTDTVVITQPAAITAFISTTPYDTCAEFPMCYPYGSATVDSAFGGTPPYTYTWPDMSNGNYWMATSYGSLTLTITDSLGCTATIPFNVGTIGTITYFYDYPVVIPDTNNMGVGSICLNANGGNYNWCCLLPNSDCVYYLTSGTYCCTVTPFINCTCSGPDSTVCITVGNIVSTGLGKVSSSNSGITITPNPNNGVFTVSLSHAELVSASHPIIEVYNVMGQKVTVATLNPPDGGQGDNLINLSQQPNGIYLYRVIKEDGNLIGEGKIIVQK